MTNLQTVSLCRNRLLLWLVGIAFAISACGTQSPEELFADAEAAAADSSSRTQAVEALGSFIEKYPDHESSPKALKLLAVLAQQAGEVEGAIGHYEQLLADYPKSQYAAEAQFMVAYILEEYLKDFDEARLAYQRVIDNFPESDLAVSARHLLPHLGRDPEEWVKFGDGGDAKN